MINLIIRVLATAICLLIASFFTPGMSIHGFGNAIVLGIVLGLINWLIVSFTNLTPSPTGRGVGGFILAAIVLYLGGQFVEGTQITVVGALIGALVLGIVNAIIPAGNVF